MSPDEPRSRKEKKALRDAERQQGKKRKHGETEEPAAVPGPESDVESGADAKKQQQASERTGTDGEVEAAAAADCQRRKKRRKKGGGEDDKPGKNRFIVFVGNLPYHTTHAALDQHFAKLKPYTLRHRTDPQTQKSRGFAFLEFENYDRMKTCLKLYHHSLFDPDAAGTGTGTPPAPGDAVPPRSRQTKSTARKINVELTAGGGGNASARKDKVKAKNARLDEQRKRRAEGERAATAKQAGKDAEGGGKQGKPAAGRKKKTTTTTTVTEQREKAAGAGTEHTSHGIHPSRARMLGTR